jgi:hypothetical protein
MFEYFLVHGHRTNLPQGVDICTSEEDQIFLDYTERGPLKFNYLAIKIKSGTIRKGKVIYQMRVSFHFRLCNLHNLNIQNLNILLRFLLINPRILNLVNNIQTLNRPPKNRMLIIKPRLQHIHQQSFLTYTNKKEIGNLQSSPS